MTDLARIACALEAPVARWTPVTRGYTRAARGVVVLEDGRSAFVKLATDDPTARWLRAERRIYEALAGADLLPRCLAWDDDGARPLLALEDLSAAAWPPPWSAERVALVQDALARLARLAPPAGLDPVAGLGLVDLGWPAVAREPGPLLSLGLCSAAWLERALPALLDAAATAPLAGDALLHLDVRSDNLCFRPGGGAVLVDWNWAAVGDPRVDLAFFAPSLTLEGGPPPEALVGHEPGLAAVVSGFFAAHAGLPPGDTSPRVRALQRAQLEVALPWAARALGLGAP